MSSRSKHHGTPSGLVRPGTAYGGCPPAVYRTLSLLVELGDEQSVRQYLQANPQAHEPILALTEAVFRAGSRVASEASSPKDVAVNDHLHRYTAEEIWMIDLAIDIGAMFAYGGGISDSLIRENAIWKLRELDEDVHSHHWKHEVRKADPGPAQFHELRAHVPHHKPHPK
jgi:hypothetical protein